MTLSSSSSDDSHAFESGDIKPFFLANDLLNDHNALHNQFEKDGYLFFKSAIPPDALRQVHSDFHDVMARLGVAEQSLSSGCMQAACKPFREGESAYFQVHDQLYVVESFHHLAHQPELIRIMKAVLGESAFPHPLAIIRLVFPDNFPVTTPPHQDFPNNQGSNLLTAAWIPLTDCPVEMGPLVVLRGSHKFGVMPLKHHLGPGNRAAKLASELTELEWHGGDFELGDILVFGALTVHSARHNHHPSQMRISVDFRYQPEGEPLTEQCLEPHFGRLSWEDIYSNWTSSDIKFYWREKDFSVVPWDPALQSISEEDAAKGLKAALKYAVDRGELKLDLRKT